MGRIAAAAVCTAIATLLLNGCQRSPAPVVTTAPLTLDKLRNAEYASQWTRSGKVRLVNGQYREPAAPGAATEIIVRATDLYAFGDLNSDGIDDAVVILESDPGGSGVFFDLVPVLNRNGTPQVFSPVPLGDRVEVTGLDVNEGRVKVRLLKHGPDDPQCCPSLDVTLHYRLGPEGLINEGQEPSRRSASPLTRKVVKSRTPTAPMFS